MGKCKKDDIWQIINLVILCIFVAALISLCGLTADYFLIYEEFLDAVQGNCLTVYSAYHKDPITCSCGGGQHNQCRSAYPCLQIFVKLFENGTAVTPLAPAVNSPQGYPQMFNNERARQTRCSYKTACKSYEKNAEDVKKFEDQYGYPGANYTCHYLPEKPDTIIRTISGNNTRFFHMFFWSCLFMVLPIIYFLIVRIIKREKSWWWVFGLQMVVDCMKECCCKKKNNSVSSQNGNVVNGNSYANNAYDNTKYGMEGNYSGPHDGSQMNSEPIYSPKGN